MRITKAMLDGFIKHEGLSWARFASYIRPRAPRGTAFDMATRVSPIRAVDQERFRAAMIARARDNIKRGNATLQRFELAE